jgi:hypothetical protein
VYFVGHVSRTSSHKINIKHARITGNVVKEVSLNLHWSNRSNENVFLFVVMNFRDNAYAFSADQYDIIGVRSRYDEIPEDESLHLCCYMEFVRFRPISLLAQLIKMLLIDIGARNAIQNTKFLHVVRLEMVNKRVPSSLPMLQCGSTFLAAEITI